MSVPRIQFQFQDVSDSIALGWTENFYMKTGNALINLSNSASPAIVNARLSLLGTDYRLSQIRSQGSTRSDVSIRTYTLATGQGTFPPPAPPVRTSEQPWDAVLVSIQAGAGSKRNFAMRGIPTGVFLDTFTIGNTPLWLQNFILWRNAVVANANYCTRVASYPQSIQLSIATVLGNQKQISVTFPTSAFTWLVRGQLVRIRGVQGASPVNHNWRISDVTVTGGNQTVTMYSSRRQIFGTPIIATGFMDQVVYTTSDPFNDMAPLRGMKRNTGRPPALLRGRSSARRT